MITKLRAKLLSDPQPQFVIAGITGIHPSRLSEYSLGQKPIKNHHMELLCQYFKCEPEDLRGKIDHPDIVERPNVDFSKEGVFEDAYPRSR